MQVTYIRLRHVFLMTGLVAGLLILGAFHIPTGPGAMARSSLDQEGDPPVRGVAAAVGQVGVLDLRVLDDKGNPVDRALAVFASKQTVGRKKGGLCESWDYTNRQGYVVLPPLQIGEISLSVYKRKYKRVYMDLQPSQLANRIVVALKKS